MGASLPVLDAWSLFQDAGFLENPYPRLGELLARGPIHHNERTGDYFIFGHKEFDLIGRSPRMGRDMRLWRSPFNWNLPENRVRSPDAFRLFSEFQPQMITSNPPDHTRMQAAFAPFFLPGAIRGMEERIRREANRLLDAMPDEGEVNLIPSYAGPFPLRIIRGLFEIPEEMDEQIAAWSAALIKLGDIDMTPAQKQQALDAVIAFKWYLREFVAERKKKPGCGPIDRVIASAENGGSLSEDEMITNLLSMLIAGHETTVTLIGNGMLCLLRFPDQLHLLRKRPELIESAVEEFLRYEPGGNMILRVAIEDTDVFGTLVPQGALCVGLVGAANRDPEVFTDPDAFRIDRNPNPHLTFGRGIHHCIGAALARTEGRIAFEAILARYSSIELASPPRWRLDRLNARGLGELKVSVKGNRGGG